MASKGRRARRRCDFASPAAPIPAVPSNLEALATEPEDFIVLSFELPKAHVRPLTPVESEIAALVVAGRTNAELLRPRR